MQRTPILMALTLTLTLTAPACDGTGGGTDDSSAPGGDDAMMATDATMPDDAGDAWRDPNTLPDGAPNPCLMATDCNACTAITPCGWCNGHCLAGTETASYDGTCSGTRWQWRGVQCGGGEQCATHTDCASCAGDPNSCGWCANTHQCLAGDSAGPSSATNGCTTGSRTWVYNLEMTACP